MPILSLCGLWSSRALAQYLQYMVLSSVIAGSHAKGPDRYKSPMGCKPAYLTSYWEVIRSNLRGVFSCCFCIFCFFTRHVSDKDRQSKLYRNVQPVFSIDDEDEDGGIDFSV